MHFGRTDRPHSGPCLAGELPGSLVPDSSTSQESFPQRPPKACRGKTDAEPQATAPAVARESSPRSLYPQIQAPPISRHWRRAQSQSGHQIAETSPNHRLKIVMRLPVILIGRTLCAATVYSRKAVRSIRNSIFAPPGMTAPGSAIPAGSAIGRNGIANYQASGCA
jgi:hypothetical protein